jgi:RNA polymerase sigma-70 factor (ECF subfamily)
MPKSELEKLIEIYQNRLYLFSLFLTRDSDLANDLLQDCYESILKSKSSYHPEMGSFLSWAKVIIRNKYMDHLKKKTLVVQRYEENQEVNHPIHSSNNDNNLTGFIQKFIQKLKEPEKTLIQLKIYDKLTLDQMSSKMGINRRTLSRMYGKILEALRIQLKEANKDD